ncbi:MAG: Hpt domain-containing protein [Desulfobacter sp.]|nr:MAG: Hpt domain-containing protein [Desulfobacter sp.]
MDFESLAARLEIDAEDFLELVDLFITTSRSDMDKIQKGMDDQNPLDASAAAHSIKGAAGNMGFDEMAGLAQKMELQGKQGSLEGFAAYLSELERCLTGIENQLPGN